MRDWVTSSSSFARMRLLPESLNFVILQSFSLFAMVFEDRDILFNAFFDEVSQGYQEGEIYKGGMQLENEMGYVDDAMIKVKFYQ